MNENWEKWEPISVLDGMFDINNIKYTINGEFKFKLSRCIWVPIIPEEDIVFIEYGIKCTKQLVTEVRKQVVFTFKNRIYAHRETDETFRWQTYEWLGENYGKDFYTKWAFFKITNSLYLKELSEQSLGFADTYPLTHYVFLTVNSILDVVATCEPIVEVMD